MAVLPFSFALSARAARVIFPGSSLTGSGSNSGKENIQKGAPLTPSQGVSHWMFLTLQLIFSAVLVRLPKFQACASTGFCLWGHLLRETHRSSVSTWACLPRLKGGGLLSECSSLMLQKATDFQFFQPFLNVRIGMAFCVRTRIRILNIFLLFFSPFDWRVWSLHLISLLVF